MSTNNQSPKMVQVKEHDLKCPACFNNLFFMDSAQLKTGTATFFNKDWTNTSATYFVCSECTHILWFLESHYIKVR